jgi:hypothetical protein
MYNTQLRLYEKKIDIMIDSGKLRKTVYKMMSRNMRKPEDKPVQHVNCYIKQSAMEGMIYMAMKNRNCQNK